MKSRCCRGQKSQDRLLRPGLSVSIIARRVRVILSEPRPWAGNRNKRAQRQCLPSRNSSAQKGSKHGPLEAVAGVAQVCGKFQSMLASSDELRDVAEEFRRCWPIFKAQELRRLGVITFWRGNRARTIQHYLHAQAKQIGPEYWLRHNEAHEKIPLDFPHTAAALYRVRCNLFHGDKIPH